MSPALQHRSVCAVVSYPLCFNFTLATSAPTGKYCDSWETAVAVEMPTREGMPLTASHTPLLTLHMLWVDLSKCFMEFSREVGQLLQARRGVPAQVRKAVWNLYSRPHGSFDSAFGCWDDFASLSVAASLLPTSSAPMRGGTVGRSL